MSRSNLDINDFVIAAKSDRGSAAAAPVTQRIAGQSEPVATDQASAPGVLPKLPEEERRQKATKRAIVREDARLALKQLKRAKEREAKFYVNVALSYDLKNRLKQAAHENDVNMTIVVQAAIESYLADNGY